MAKVASKLKVDDVIEITGFHRNVRSGRVTRVQEKSFELNGKEWYRDSEILEWKKLGQRETEPYKVDLGQSPDATIEACERIRFALLAQQLIIIRVTRPLNHPTPDFEQSFIEVSADVRPQGAVLSVTCTKHRRDDFTDPTVSIANGVVILSSYTGDRLDTCCIYITR